MLILLTYDVSTVDAAGKRRLRMVAKHCVKHGQRVQNSVFELSLNQAELVKFSSELKELINQEQDSLRFYNLGNQYRLKVEHYGAKPTYMPDDVLIV